LGTHTGPHVIIVGATQEGESEGPTWVGLHISGPVEPCPEEGAHLDGLIEGLPRQKKVLPALSEDQIPRMRERFGLLCLG
jgi:hypothetical protein